MTELIADIWRTAGDRHACTSGGSAKAGTLAQWEELHLIDPYLSDSLTAKYAETDRPQRTSRAVVDRNGWTSSIS
jgi:hypothetical protein